MLYERWSHLATELASELAVIDMATNRSWTFADLKREEERTRSEDEVIYPSGHSMQFLLSVVAAWREKKVLCPIETNQVPPPLQGLPESIQHVKITSATSGPPKLILFREEQLLTDAENIVSTMGLQKDCPNIAAISLAHSYGFSNLVLPLFLFGIPLILVPAPLPELIRKASSLVPTVTIPAVPALWRTWHEADALGSNIAQAISAGAPLPLSLEAEVVKRRGIKLHNFYGSSECGGIAYDRSDSVREDAAFAGTAMDNVSLSTTSEGLLVVQSKAVGESYWPSAEPTLGAGRFQTSDLAKLEQGRVTLLGRAGDFLNIAGRKIAPAILEEKILGHASVRECVVFSVPDPQSQRMERIVACVHPCGSITGQELTRFLTEQIPAWQIPREWWFSHEPLTNQRGKLARAEWRDRYIKRQS